ncbi:hypothetical protein D9M71_228670 [compost metagenome]
MGSASDWDLPPIISTYAHWLLLATSHFETFPNGELPLWLHLCHAMRNPVAESAHRWGEVAILGVDDRQRHSRRGESWQNLTQLTATKVRDYQIACCANQSESLQTAREIGVGVVDGYAFLDMGCSFLSVDHEAPMGSATAAIGQEAHGMMMAEIVQELGFTVLLQVGR